jgi:chorismate mutase/prephenate dehydratase
LREYLPGVELLPASSNAEGARRARDEAGTAAIAGDAAAEVYGLQKLVSDIEDRPDNTTRFLVIGRELLAASGNDKTSLLLSTQDTDDAGALQKLLAPLAQHQVNMSRIESRPSRRRKWHYVFFVDIDGHAGDKNVALALAELKKRAQLFRILGSYPKAIL